MSTLPNADAARLAAATGPQELPSFLMRREAGVQPTIRPMTFGTAPARPRVEPTIRPMPLPADVRPSELAAIRGLSPARAAYQALMSIMVRAVDLDTAGLQGDFEFPAGSDNSSLAIVTGQHGATLTVFGFHPDNGVSMVESFALAVRHVDQELAVTAHELHSSAPLPEQESDTPADWAGDLVAVLVAARDAGARLKLQPIGAPTDAPPPAPKAKRARRTAAPVVALPPAGTAPAAAFARTFAALDSGAAMMPPALEGMSAVEQRAALAPFRPAMVVEAAASPAGVVVDFRPTAPRPFPKAIDRQPIAALLPPDDEPDQTIASAPLVIRDPTEAECDAVCAAMSADLAARGIQIPAEAFDVEQSGETGALWAIPYLDHEAWAAAPPRRAMSRRAAAAPLPSTPAPLPAAAAPLPQGLLGAVLDLPGPLVPASMAAPVQDRQERAERAPRPPRSTAPRRGGKRRHSGRGKNAPQGIDIAAILASPLVQAIGAALVQMVQPPRR